MSQAAEEQNRREDEGDAGEDHEGEIESGGAGPVPTPGPALPLRGKVGEIWGQVLGVVEDDVQGQEGVEAGDPTGLRGVGVAGGIYIVQMQEIDFVQEVEADEIDHDEEIKAEDGAAGADFEGGDGHGHGAGDECGGWRR